MLTRLEFCELLLKSLILYVCELSQALNVHRFLSANTLARRMPKDILKKNSSTNTTQGNYQQATVTRRNCAERCRLRRGDRLCTRCRSLDLHRLFETRKNNIASPKSWEATVYFLGVVQQSMLKSPCPLCRLFATLLPQGHKAVQQTFVLKAFSALQHHFRYTYRKKQVQDTTILSLAPLGAVLWNPNLERKRGVIYLADEQGKHQHQNILGNKINSHRVDYEMTKHWIQYCRVNHKGYCKHQPPTVAHSIPGFKSIDCETRRVVEHTSRAEYVALSYVWGSASHASTRSLPNPAARVIEDAITVTKQLGFRYLWVDRYCISQIDPLESREQIAKMDQIYAGAVVTIVAAAGEDPHYGLPGVSHTPRQTQPCATSGNFHLVSSLRAPRDIVKSSKWASRGWTFQEMKLSRRTLYFTDDQMLFECASMSCQETIHMPLAVAHREQSASMGGECNRARIFPPNGPGSSPIGILDVISEYTSRSLTHETDTLNALLGIFNAFGNNCSSQRTSSSKPTPNPSTRRSSAQMYHLWGLPILSCAALGFGDSPVDQSFCAMLAWRSNSPSSRSPGFPSWSWTGWKLPTEAQFCIRKTPDPLFQYPTSPLKAWLHLHPGRKIAFDALEQQSNLADILKDASRALIVQGHIRKFRFRRTNCAMFPLEPIGYSGEHLSFWPDSRMSSDDMQKFTERRWKALNISWGLFSIYWLVLKRIDFGYERVGIIGGCSDYNRGVPVPSLQSSSQGKLIVLR